MPWAVPVAIAGASIVSGAMGANAAKDAAAQQADSARASTAAQLQMYNQTRADNAPWRDAGVQALGNLNGELPELSRKFSMSDFQADPGYAFRMQQAQKAIDNSASSRGLVNSGATMKAISNYNQDAASQEYNNAYNRFTTNQNQRFNQLAGVAGVGQVANAQNGQAAMQTGAQIGQNITGAGNAAAAGTIGSANAISNGVGQGMNSWMNYSMMNRMFPDKSGG